MALDCWNVYIHDSASVFRGSRNLPGWDTALLGIKRDAKDLGVYSSISRLGISL
jgi:hypothetical protein